MLTTGFESLGREFGDLIQGYLIEVLHVDFRVEGIDCPGALPNFYRSIYTFYQTTIFSEKCIIIATKDEGVTPAQIAKHIAVVGSKVGGIILFAAPSLSAYNRDRLIKHAVSFIVPNNQLYIHKLAIDLRERLVTSNAQSVNHLTPGAQAVLFHHILRINETATTQSEIAKDLNYSVMTIGRAFEILEALSLAKTRKVGKERHIYFTEDRKMLYERALPLCRNPIRSRKYLEAVSGLPEMKLSGENALAELTDLSESTIVVFAVSPNFWKDQLTKYDFVEVDASSADLVIEVWNYDPSALSADKTVDPLSLYVQYWNHPNERVAYSAEQLMKGISW